MTRDAFDATAAPVWEALAALASRFPNVELVDPAPWFCTEHDCPALREGLPLYRDRDHLTATAARDFAAAWMSDPARYERSRGAAAPPDRR